MSRNPSTPLGVPGRDRGWRESHGFGLRFYVYFLSKTRCTVVHVFIDVYKSFLQRQQQQLRPYFFSTVTKAVITTFLVGEKLLIRHIVTIHPRGKPDDS